MNNLIQIKGACILKSFFPGRVLFVLTIIFFFHNRALAQTYTSSNPGNFGIDGDVYSDTVLTGTFTAAGSHDWFYKTGGSGNSVFDTTGASYARQQIQAGINYGFSKKMQYPQYTTVGGDLFLDGVYTRDYIGNSTNLDLTAFNTTNSNTSAMDPTTWTTMPSGSSSIPSKVDIIDTYIHMRRLSSTSNHIIAFLGASTLATSGNRYFDFEFYKTQAGYDATTGKFSNTGPSATGGHSAWTFNSDGSIAGFGDLTLSFSFSSTAVNSIDIYIWVSYSTYSTVKPLGFDFTSGSWIGLSNNSGYGYAHIQAKTGSSLQAWGMVNTSAVAGPPWAGSYSSGQFAEAAIDLTTLGIDPLITVSTDPCAPPYTRVLVKSRSSSSFSAALQDFVGPIVFLNSAAMASIATPSTLTCSSPTTVLFPKSPVTSNVYTWATGNGSFYTRTDSSAAGVNQPGTYYLTAQSSGCNNKTMDSVTVQQDTYKPVAKAYYTGALTGQPGSSISLQGGDTAASNYSTPFGGSQGLTWNWTGPNGFSSTLENPTATDSGTYKLTVTEQRNGCTATASVKATYAFVLGSSLLNFQGSYDQGKAVVNLTWQFHDAGANEVFAIEKSLDGRVFSTCGYQTLSIDGVNYCFQDPESSLSTLFYRIRQEKSGHFSPVIQVSSFPSSFSAFVNSNGQVMIRYSSVNNDKVQVKLFGLNGANYYNTTLSISAGSGLIALPHLRATGILLLYIETSQGGTTQKILL